MLFATVPVVAAAALSLFTVCSAQMPTAMCPSGEYTLVDPSSRPSTRNCETLGYLVSPSPLGDPVTAGSLDACVQTCKRTTGCVSFGYSASNSTSCVLYSKKLIDMKYRQPKMDKGTVFANQLCYRCKPLLCTNPEIIRNGGFEIAGATDAFAAGWSPVPDDSTDIERSMSYVHDGEWGLYVAMLTSTATGAVEQTLECVQVGVEYVVTAWFLNAVSSSFFMSLDGVVFYTGSNRDRSWTKATATITPTNATPRLRLGFTPGTDLIHAIDTVSMQIKTPE